MGNCIEVNGIYAIPGQVRLRLNLLIFITHFAHHGDTKTSVKALDPFGLQ